ncbi:MAG: hypothetical protein HN509_12100, partial [Halobacteriovoraceae bacterium]|nr:hypothetical protein [Halobacteriovoraceae bacterium]
MAKYILVRLSIISLLFLSSFSCGVKDEVNPDLEVFDIEEAGAGPNCKFDTAKLAKILEEDIHGEIKCLEANLDNFVKFVRRENPNYISLSELKSFIQRFFPENADKVHKLLGFVFKLNTLLLKDPHESISLANLPLLFELFQIVNIEGQKLSKELKEFNKNTYWENRNTMFAAASALGTKGLDVTKRRKDNETSTLDIPDFLEKIKDLLELTDEQFNIDLIKDYLFAKKLILGGDKNILTSSQFTGLLEKAPSLLITGLDAISISTKEFKTKETEWFFYFDLVNDLRSFFFIQPDSDVIVEQDNLLRIAEKLLDNKYDIVKQMGSSIKKVKPKLIGGDKQFYSYKDAKALIGLAQDFFGAQYFNDITYSHFKRVLDSPLPIINLRNPNLPEYQLFSKSQIKYLWNEFRFVTEHYRYFSDSAGFINFHNTYKRTRKGYSQNTTLRWAFKKLIHAYGSFRGERRKEVSIDEMRVLLYDIKGILKEPNLNF